MPCNNGDEMTFADSAIQDTMCKTNGKQLLAASLVFALEYYCLADIYNNTYYVEPVVLIFEA